ncbi:hypothetical protein V8F06_012753 [Rhypophila decipiens]
MLMKRVLLIVAWQFCVGWGARYLVDAPDCIASLAARFPRGRGLVDVWLFAMAITSSTERWLPVGFVDLSMAHCSNEKVAATSLAGAWAARVRGERASKLAICMKLTILNGGGKLGSRRMI